LRFAAAAKIASAFGAARANSSRIKLINKKIDKKIGKEEATAARRTRGGGDEGVALFEVLALAELPSVQLRL